MITVLDTQAKIDSGCHLLSMAVRPISRDGLPQLEDLPLFSVFSLALRHAKPIAIPLTARKPLIPNLQILTFPMKTFDYL
jgi:hypothetical protein